MKHLAAASAFLTALMAIAPCAAQAQGQAAYTAKTVNLRAGPARDYPVVAVLPAGIAIGVQGCLADYSWCDVIAGPDRGWAYGGNISYDYQGANVPVLDYGAVIGIGVLGFALNDYWGSYYRGRPWYRERDRWAHRPAPPMRPRPHRPPGAGPGPGPRPPGSFPVPMPPRAPGVVPRPRPQPPQGATPGGQRPPRGDRPGRPPQVQGQGQGQGRERGQGQGHGTGREHPNR